MNRITVLCIVLLSTVFALPILAQEQPGKQRGRGFGGGQGKGPGRGMRMRDNANNNQAPGKSYEKNNPVIAGYGDVVRLPDAAQQPRQGTKLIVDLTTGGEAGKLNSGLEKVAKYLNIYGGGGAQAADVQIAVVFHGEATLSVLHADAYAMKFKTDGNPNLHLLEELHKSGVELFVCGQSLIAKGSTPDEVADVVTTAVSALTTLVNLQTDGYAYIPLSITATANSPQPSPANPIEVEANHSHDGIARSGLGRGMGPSMGRGMGAMPEMQGDMNTLHAMFADRNKIKRSVKNLPNGAVALTESDDNAVANLLKQHVPAMEERVLGNKPLPPMTFHPVFIELIKHADDYSLTYTETEQGIKVTYHSEDPYVVMLVQEHAKLVSRFIENGMEEIHAPYTLPEFDKQKGETKK